MELERRQGETERGTKSWRKRNKLDDNKHGTYSELETRIAFTNVKAQICTLSPCWPLVLVQSGMLDVMGESELLVA